MLVDEFKIAEELLRRLVKEARASGCFASQPRVLAGIPIGLLKVARDGANWDLIQIQIAPERQGQGLGSVILRKLLDEAVQSRATVTLSVLKANPARRLYERFGFRIVGENDQAYDMQFGAMIE